LDAPAICGNNVVVVGDGIVATDLDTAIFPLCPGRELERIAVLPAEVVSRVLSSAARALLGGDRM